MGDGARQMLGPDTPRRSDEVDSAFVAAFDCGDFDKAWSWLHVETWPAETGNFDRIVVSLCDIMMSADPAATIPLLWKVARRSAEPLGRAHVLQRLLDAAARIRNRSEMTVAMNELSGLIDQLPQDSRVPLLNNAGTFLKDGGDFDSAEATLSRALELAGASASEDRVTLLVNLALVQVDRGFRGPDPRPAGAERGLELLRQAHDIAVQLHAARALGNIWFNRGHIEGQLGREAAARYGYAQAAIWFAQAGSEPRDLAFVRRAQAATDAKVGRFGQAASAYGEARDLFLEAGELDEAARTTVGLVMASFKAGTPPSDDELDRLLDVVELSRPHEVPDLLMNLGNIAISTQPQRSLGVFREAGRRYRHQHQEHDRVRAAHATATTLRLLGRPHAARRLIGVVRHRYLRAGLPLKVAEVDHNKALVERDLGEFDAALESALSAVAGLDAHRHSLMSAEDRAMLITKVYPHAFDLALDLALHADAYDVVAALAERARVQTLPLRDQLPGGWQLAPPPPVSARPSARPVEGTGDKIDISELTVSVGGPGSVWLSWVHHRNELIRIVVHAGGSEVSRHTWPEDLLSELHKCFADPTATDVGRCPDRRTADRLAIFRAATRPLLDDPTLARRFFHTLPLRVRTDPDSESFRNQKELLAALAAVLLPPDLAAFRGTLLLAPPPELGRVPWAALTASSSEGLVPTALVEQTDFVLVPPVATLGQRPLAATSTSPPPRGLPKRSKVWVADPRGDLPFCRRVPARGWIVLGGAGHPRATRPALASHLKDCELLVVRAHVKAGSLSDPASTAVLLDGTDELSARDLLTAGLPCPPHVVVLGCDAAGAATGDEWAGLPVGFGQAGALEVLVTQWPVIDDPTQEQLDLTLVDAVVEAGASFGLRAWQRAQARLWRQDPSLASPYRWANPVIVATSWTSVEENP